MFSRSLLFSALMLLAALAVRPATAAAAPAAQDLYTVAGIHVDAVGASSTEAFNAAILQGRPKAFTILFHRLTRQQDWGREPPLDAAALARLSRGFTVANERRSTTRYVADVTYIFNSDSVARLLRGAGIAYSATPARRILLVAMAPGVTHGPWAQALAAAEAGDSLVPFEVAGPADDKALGDLDFDNAGWNDVAAAAGRIEASEAALVQAAYSDGHVAVKIRHLGLGLAPTVTQVQVPLLQTVGTTYPAAAQAAVQAIEDMWKARTAVDFSQHGRLSADVRLDSLEQWGGLQKALAGLSNVTQVTVTAMDIGYARIAIAYTGTSDQLRDALSGAGVSLTNRGGQWFIAAAGK
jgi:hypothetical protein